MNIDTNLPNSNSNLPKIKGRIRQQKFENLNVFRATSTTEVFMCQICNHIVNTKKELYTHFQIVHKVYQECVDQMCFIDNSEQASQPRNRNTVPIQSYTNSLNSILNHLPDIVNNSIDMDFNSLNSNRDIGYSQYLSEDFQLSNHINTLDCTLNTDEVGSSDELDIGEDANDSFYSTFEQISHNINQSDYINSLSSKDCYPYPDVGTLILHTLLYSEQSKLSRNVMKKILLTIELFLKLYEISLQSNNSCNFKLPSLRSLYEYPIKLKNHLPKFPTKIVNINKDGFNKQAYLNLPSEYLKFLFSSPSHCKSLSAIPDQSLNCYKSLNQCYKWNTHSLFKCNMYTYYNFDYWSGDIVKFNSSYNNVGFLIDNFFNFNNITMVQGYKVYYIDTNNPIIKLEISKVNINQLKPNKIQKLNKDSYLTVNNGSYIPITEHQHQLLYGEVYGKVKRTPNIYNSREYYPIRIAPLTLFSDDMNGSYHKNSSYETITVQFPGSNFANTMDPSKVYFVAGVQNSKGLNVNDLIPEIVKDLQLLERGIIIYSIEDQQYVNVIAPLLWINGDNPAHNSLCCLKAAMAHHPCRKCKKMLVTNHFASETLKCLHSEHYYTCNSIYRNKEEYQYVAKLYSLPEKTFEKQFYSNLGYKPTKASELLKLSSFNPTIDTPVEILHTLCLGIIKDIVTYSLEVFKVNGIPIKIINTAIIKFKKSNNFTPNLSYNLEYYHKYNGKDWKALIQILPYIYNNNTEFQNKPELNDVIELVSILGKMCSLIYTHHIANNLDNYINLVKTYINKFIHKLYLTEMLIVSKPNSSVKFLHKLKFHLLMHIIEDIKQFGPAVNFSSETSESYNKFVRKNIASSNYKNVERDLAIKFGREFIHKHIIKGGYWFKDNNRYNLSQNVLNFFNSVNKNFIDIMLPKSEFITEIIGYNYSSLINLKNKCAKNNSIAIVLLSQYLPLQNNELVTYIALLKYNSLFQMSYIPGSIDNSNCVKIQISKENRYLNIDNQSLSLEHIFHIAYHNNNIFTLNLNKLGSTWHFMNLYNIS
jgi:hypothetical protein